MSPISTSDPQIDPWGQRPETILLKKTYNTVGHFWEMCLNTCFLLKLGHFPSFSCCWWRVFEVKDPDVLCGTSIRRQQISPVSPRTFRPLGLTRHEIRVSPCTSPSRWVSAARFKADTMKWQGLWITEQVSQPLLHRTGPFTTAITTTMLCCLHYPAIQSSWCAWGGGGVEHTNVPDTLLSSLGSRGPNSPGRRRLVMTAVPSRRVRLIVLIR